MQPITSFQNSKIKLANKLVSKRQREKSGLFLIDDERDLSRALDCGYAVEYALFCPALATEADHAVIERVDSAVFEVNAELMAKASYRQNPGGVVAVMAQKPTLGMNDALMVTTGDALVLVDLKKPGNIGALLRTADAAGIGMVWLVDSSLDVYNPNVIRASTGTVFNGNVYEMSVNEARQVFKAKEMQVIAAHLAGEESLYDVDFRQGRNAIVLGTEDVGLDDWWIDHCDMLVKIPMMGSVSDSLNVSVSGAVMMYEALRQRLAQV